MRFNFHTVPISTNIVLPNGSRTFSVGTDITLDCLVEGYPTPKVTWYKDSVALVPSNRVHISG
jgi:Immunoglobulin domain